MSYQLAQTLQDVANIMENFADEAFEAGQRDTSETRTIQVGALRTAAADIVSLRNALARLYLAVQWAKLHRPSTLKELHVALTEAQAALGWKRGKAVKS